MKSATIQVEVVYALPRQQTLLGVAVPSGTTALQAVAESGIQRHHPEIDSSACALGLFGRKVAPDTPLREGDRVEIYRPLKLDPKERRRQRAGQFQPG